MESIIISSNNEADIKLMSKFAKRIGLKVRKVSADELKMLINAKRKLNI